MYYRTVVRNSLFSISFESNRPSKGASRRHGASLVRINIGAHGLGRWGRAQFDRLMDRRLWDLAILDLTLESVFYFLISLFILF